MKFNNLWYVVVNSYTLSNVCIIIKLCAGAHYVLIYRKLRHKFYSFFFLFQVRIKSNFLYLSDSWLVGSSIWTIQRHKSHSFSTFLAAHARSFGLPNLRTRHLFHKKTSHIFFSVSIFIFISVNTARWAKMQKKM